ncbi:GIY-YIG nuclease family protein [Herbaspirillum sp. alder98]|uniref:GIY-YIG nuclease family protein n=1 Tax=Herbaspirillum sp. alder98 TaxID=2913096 RepID=UPI001CD8B55F|nr:GIY-YIG nuclease family protein [Herbaspirillum sp. alder98]MCA1327004.1 GIY-YIG nuclease family protein [Herbaspirillum sp. alder98]
MNFYVYILASARNGTLYIGVTRDLIKRIYQHKYEAGPGFTKKYAVNQLVHFEVFDDAINAITREKQLKNWRRSWKLQLIEKTNPYWLDLYPTII